MAFQYFDSSNFLGDHSIPKSLACLVLEAPGEEQEQEEYEKMNLIAVMYDAYSLHTLHVAFENTVTVTLTTLK